MTKRHNVVSKAEQLPLTDPQLRAVQMLMDGETISDIARSCDVVRNTIYNWMELPAFRAEVKRLRELLLESVEGDLHAATVSGAKTLLRATKEEVPMSMLNASKYALDRKLGTPTNVAKVTTAPISPEAAAWLTSCATGSDEEEGE